MAFIAKLPDAAALLQQPVAGLSGSYGPHLTYQYSAPNGNAVSLMKGTTALVDVHASGRMTVHLGELDAITVPYANRFILSSGQVIIKDWRTLQYRTKVRRGGRKAVKPATLAAVPPASSKPKPVSVALPPVSVEETPNPDAETVSTTLPAQGAVITLTEGESKVADPIPGMVYPSGIAPKTKGAGRGWTNMGGYVMPDVDVDTLDRAWNLRQQGLPAAVLVTGPAGTAKTMMVQAFAAAKGVPYLKVDCSTIRSVDDWSGGFKQDPNTKTWAHRWSPFARALREAKPCVLLLDELTRTETPAALNGILGMLDETGSLNVPDANTVLTLPKGVLIIATANIGPEFVGTLPLDGAVRQRFPYGVRMNYPTEAIEAKLLCDRTNVTRETADSLVRMAVQQRMHRDDAQRFPSGSIISTRLLLSMAASISDGAMPRDAIWSVLKAQFDPADEAALTIVVDSQFPKVAPAPAPSEPATILAGKHVFIANPFDNSICGYLQPGATSKTPSCGRAKGDPLHY